MDAVDSLSTSWLWSTILPSVAVPSTLFLVAWLLWGTYYHVWSYDRTLGLPLPPGSMGLPFLGETLSLLAQGTNFYISRQKKHGGVFKTFLFGEPIVRIRGSAAVRKILTSDSSTVGAHMVYSARHLLGGGTISSTPDGSHHRFLRKGLLRALNHAALAQYSQTTQEMTRAAIEDWCQVPTVVGYSEIKKLVLRLLFRLFLGLDFNNNNNNQCNVADNITEDEDEIVQAFRTYIGGLFSLPVMLPGTGLYRAVQAKKTILGMVDRCVRAKQRQLQPQDHEAKNPSEKCVIDWALQQTRFEPAAGQEEEDRPLTVEELKMMIVEMFFAGQSTLSSSACMMLYYLARNPVVVEKATTELEQFNLICDHPCNVDIEVLSKLTYLDQVVKEVLRISPPVGGLFRKALKPLEVNGYQVPKGWALVLSVRETHSSTHLLGEQPEQFLPERWDKVYGLDDAQHGPAHPQASRTRPSGPRQQGQGQDQSSSAGQGPPPTSQGPAAEPEAKAEATESSQGPVAETEAKAEATERSQEPERTVLDPYGFFPFGRGSRSCPGQVLARLVLKVLALEMVRGCRWRLLNEDVALRRLPVPHPTDGLLMQVTPLQSQGKAEQ